MVEQDNKEIIYITPDEGKISGLILVIMLSLFGYGIISLVNAEFLSDFINSSLRTSITIVVVVIFGGLVLLMATVFIKGITFEISIVNNEILNVETQFGIINRKNTIRIEEIDHFYYEEVTKYNVSEHTYSVNPKVKMSLLANFKLVDGRPRKPVKIYGLYDNRAKMEQMAVTVSEKTGIELKRAGY